MYTTDKTHIKHIQTTDKTGKHNLLNIYKPHKRIYNTYKTDQQLIKTYKNKLKHLFFIGFCCFVGVLLFCCFSFLLLFCCFVVLLFCCVKFINARCSCRGLVCITNQAFVDCLPSFISTTLLTCIYLPCIR